MIPLSSGIRILIATGDTEMLRGINLFALQVQQGLDLAPHAGEFIVVFRGRRGDLVKLLWHDMLGMSLYVKQLAHGRFI